MAENPTEYISMREAARMCCVPLSTFRTSFLQGFYPFKLYRVSTYRNKFRRDDVQAYVDAQEERIVELPEGAQITAMGVERVAP